MTTQQLESFIHVAENLNFARAAEELNITTSAVSRQIQALEEELDVKLLHRSTRSVSLTPAGIIFFNDAKDILAKLQITTQKIKNHTDANLQIISIGCTSESDLTIIAKLLKHSRKQQPEIHPFIRIVPSRLILNMLIHDEIDLLFGYQDHIPMRDNFEYYELVHIPVCCVLPVGHPLCQKEIISEKDLLSENIVICNSYEIPTPVMDIQNRLSHKFVPNTTYYSENVPAMLTLIKAGYGVGVLPEISSTDTELISIPFDTGFSLSYGMFYKKTIQNPTLKKLISIIKRIRR